MARGVYHTVNGVYTTVAESRLTLVFHGWCVCVCVQVSRGSHYLHVWTALQLLWQSRISFQSFRPACSVTPHSPRQSLKVQSFEPKQSLPDVSAFTTFMCLWSWYFIDLSKLEPENECWTLQIRITSSNELIKIWVYVCLPQAGRHLCRNDSGMSWYVSQLPSINTRAAAQQLTKKTTHRKHFKG